MFAEPFLFWMLHFRLIIFCCHVFQPPLKIFAWYHRQSFDIPMFWIHSLWKLFVHPAKPTDFWFLNSSLIGLNVLLRSYGNIYTDFPSGQNIKVSSTDLSYMISFSIAILKAISLKYSMYKNVNNNHMYIFKKILIFFILFVFNYLKHSVFYYSF